MINYRAVYSVLKGLLRRGVRVTLTPADLRPARTSRINWRHASESALTVMIFRPVLYVKELLLTALTRRFSSLIRLTLPAGISCGIAADRLGLCQVVSAGETDVVPVSRRITAIMLNKRFTGGYYA